MKQTIQQKTYRLNEFEYVDYDPLKHREQLINVLVEAYLFNNPQFTELNLTKEQMRGEVIQQIENNEYCALVIYKETQEIAALAFFTESQVYKNYPKVDITKCPNRNAIRHYLRQASIQDALQNFNFPKGACCFSNGFTIARKFMGQSMGDILTLCLVQKYSERGFTYVLGNAINERAKALFRRMDSISIALVDVGELVCLDTLERPYGGKGLFYEAFLISSPGSGRKAQDRLRQQARL